MIRELTPEAAYMGLLAAFVGYAASFAVVLSGLANVGATEAEAATGLFFATLGMAVGSLWLPAVTRIPAAVAWSTPGAAFLASTPALPGGFGEAAGALIACAGLLVLTGLVPALARAVAAIPKPVANALLAGILLKLCLAPAGALGISPTLALPLIAAWVVGLTLHRLAAMPLAVLAFLVVLAVAVDLPAAPSVGGFDLLPPLSPVVPVFSLSGFVSVALPLYFVTMAGQNIPGFAVLELNGYTVDRAPLLRNTGLVSLALAAFGSIPVNMSAITAAMMSGQDAGRNPKRRYWAAMVSGMAYAGLALLAGPVAILASLAPTELIAAVAGLALIPALVGSLSGAFSEPGQIEAPAMTFLMAASGMTLLGISGAFWGLIAGVAIWGLKGLRSRRA